MYTAVHVSMPFPPCDGQVCLQKFTKYCLFQLRQRVERSVENEIWRTPRRACDTTGVSPNSDSVQRLTATRFFSI